MTSTKELKEALKDTMENRGSLEKIKGQIRSEIFHALDEQAPPKPKLSSENVFINELIREYLEYNQYNYTLSVLVAESGQPEKTLSRPFLSSQLKMKETNSSRSVPLIYSLVEQSKRANE